MNRKERRKLGHETLEILERGFYEIDGRRVDIAESLELAVQNTVEYTNRDNLPHFDQGGERETTIEVRNETTLHAASRLAESHDVAVLNFASAKNPGGGFLNGSLAQEESLAMSSGLYACLHGREMYEYHRPTKGGMYTPWAIYSPGVPVFRDDEGRLVEPYQAAFITSPAVNAGVVLERDPAAAEEVARQMEIRIAKVLAIAAHHGHEALVLGAWGCGVFRNDPSDVARMFADALSGEFRDVFEYVIFAVLDESSERRFLGPFENAFS